MFRLAALAAALVPMAALAGPAVGPKLNDSSLQHADFAPKAPVDAGGAPANGWGLRASVQGRLIDLGSRDLGWADDPAVPATDVQAGVEWRDGPAAAVVGYSQFDEGADKNPALWDRPIPQENSPATDPGVLGFSLVLRTR